MDSDRKLIFQIKKVTQFNIDRVLGYERACRLLSSRELGSLFQQCIMQSEHYSEKLRTSMIFHGVKICPKPSLPGRFFRWWMGLVVFFKRDKEVSVLKCCLEAEKMLAKIYQFACENSLLQCHYPLLKATFIKQQMILQKTRLSLEAALNAARYTSNGENYAVKIMA